MALHIPGIIPVGKWHDGCSEYKGHPAVAGLAYLEQGLWKSFPLILELELGRELIEMHGAGFTLNPHRRTRGWTLLRRNDICVPELGLPGFGSVITDSFLFIHIHDSYTYLHHCNQ